LIVEEPGVLTTVLRFLRERLIESSMLTNPLFTILSGPERRRLAAHFEFLEIDPDSLVVWQGVRSPGLFLLLSGAAEVVHDDSVEEHRLATLRPGAVFGEMSLLDGGTAMADVRCAARSYALLLPRSKFQRVAQEYPSVVEFIRLLSESRRRENEGILAANTAGKDPRP
jgi:CRP-like cAMP-binding protein